MDYVFQFGVVWRELDALLLGAWLTVRLSALAMALGLIVGVAGALATASRWRARARAGPRLRRGHPQHALPGAGALRLPRPALDRPPPAPDQAALLAMVINLGAYATEIVRAGVKAVPAGTARGRHARSACRRGSSSATSSWLPALRAIFPALGSQFILIMLASSVVSVISAEELTAVADTIVARNFRSFEFYLVVTGMYLGMASRVPGRLRGDPSRALRAAGAGVSRRDPRVHHQRGLVSGSRRALDGAALGHRLRRRRRRRLRSLRSRASRRVAPLACLAAAYIKIVQGTPLLMQLYLVYFGASLLRLTSDAWTAAALGAHALRQRLPRRDLARLHPGRSARASGRRRGHSRSAIVASCGS